MLRSIVMPYSPLDYFLLPVHSPLPDHSFSPDCLLLPVCFRLLLLAASFFACFTLLLARLLFHAVFGPVLPFWVPLRFVIGFFWTRLRWGEAYGGPVEPRFSSKGSVRQHGSHCVERLECSVSLKTHRGCPTCWAASVWWRIVVWSVSVRWL